MAYIEENLKFRMKSKDNTADAGPFEPDDDLDDIAQRWKVEKKNNTDEGSVTNSLSMLTAIPEVDLGMECVSDCSARLNILLPWLSTAPG
jgi:hypothetical protein